MPMILIGCVLLFRFIPKLDPLKRNLDDFIGYYNIFIIIFSMFLFYIFILTLMFNLYTNLLNMFIYFAPAFAILIYYTGILIANAKRNWFIGIKNPWTLSSDYVWNKTHTLGGHLFKISAIICLLGIIFPSLAIWFLLFPILFSTIYVMVYSYVVYKRENKKK
jgi:uncharacterized membrane protein